MKKKHIIAILAFTAVLAAAGALAGCGRSDTADGGGTMTLTNVSYDPTRELYKEYNELFQKHYRETTGKDIRIIQSHGVIELPFALPTAVAGITLSKLYSDTGFFGSFFASYGIQIAYTKIGLTIAMVFVGIPFVVRSIQPVLEKLDPTYEEAGSMLSASPFTIFRRIIFPELRPALLTGFGLAFARGLGEYGSVIYISGNSAKHHTQVVSYVIMQKLNYVDYASATAIALAMLVIAFVTLFSINMIQVHQARRVQ